LHLLSPTLTARLHRRITSRSPPASYSRRIARRRSQTAPKQSRPLHPPRSTTTLVLHLASSPLTFLCSLELDFFLVPFTALLSASPRGLFHFPRHITIAAASHYTVFCIFDTREHLPSSVEQTPASLPAYPVLAYCQRPPATRFHTRRWTRLTA
ncbi:hypothetical protein K505DRAFT_283458, partial [Melanomma pulvis-pyrius CBS 109.77]